MARASEQWVQNSEDVKEYSSRYPFVLALITGVALLLAGRLWYLQIIHGNELRKYSEEIRFKEYKDPATRGEILDRNGKTLVDNLSSFNVNITPQYVKDLPKTAEVLSKLLKVDSKVILKDIKESIPKNGLFKPVLVKANVTIDEVAKVKRLATEFDGVEVEVAIKRNYVLGENGAQLFGYIAEISKNELPLLNNNRPDQKKFRAGDIIGKYGIEKRWDAELRGADGVRFVEVDARGRQVDKAHSLNLGTIPEPVDYNPGRNMTLTLDKDIQEALYKGFIDNKLIGSAVVLDPNSGEILGMVNLPSFDPNHFSTGIPYQVWSGLINDPFRPLRNKAIQDFFPPGSTFKAIVALAGLEEKAITPYTTFYCPGFIKFGKKIYHCASEHGHGYVNLLQAIERSCNIYFYQVGLGLGIDKIAKYAKLLGFGERTGVPLDGENRGLMPDSAWKKQRIGEEWQPGENLSHAIGQGYTLVTPLQLAQSYAAIATDGKMYQPTIIKKVEDTYGKIYAQYVPKVIKDLSDGPEKIKKENFEIIKNGLSLVFNGKSGTARRYKIPGLEVFGKTGTLQLFQLFSKDDVYKLCENRDFKQRHHGWLVAAAPRDNPKVVVSVFAEHGCHGTAGGPVLKSAMLAYFNKYHPEMIHLEKEKHTGGSTDGSSSPGENANPED